VRRRRAAVAALVVLATVGLGACSKKAPSVVDPHGPEAHRIAGTWWLMFGLAAAVYAVVGGFIVVALLRGRGTATGRASRISDNGFIWVGGLAVPLVILMVLAWATVDTTNHVRRPEKDPLKVEVVARQWWWAVSYPQYHFATANEIHVPVDRPIELGLDSDNVLHSFWVPQLGGKLDTIPGQHNVWRFKASRAGTYRGQCAEYCGLQHAHMSFLVVAEPSATFDTWALRRTNPPPAPTDQLQANGQLVFVSSPCAGCHTVRGTQAQGVIGPDLSDIGSRRTIGANTVPNTTGNLSGWVLNAQTIKPGNLMPPIDLSADQLHALVAYLQSLK